MKKLEKLGGWRSRVGDDVREDLRVALRLTWLYGVLVFPAGLKGAILSAVNHGDLLGRYRGHRVLLIAWEIIGQGRSRGGVRAA